MKQRRILFSLLLVATTAFASTQLPSEGFAPLAKKVVPSVVNIATFMRVREQQQVYGDDLMRRFFEEFMGPGYPFPGGPAPEGPLPQQAPRKKKEGPARPYALGSGFIIDSSGLILTNYHVIAQADEVKIQLTEEDRDLIPAEIVGRDPDLDVALLKVKTSRKLQALPLGDSDALEVGDFVIAVGNPVGYGHTVTHGIISAKGRQAPELKLAKYLQTDAPINPGNSGGPLINMKGEVIGINNAIDARTQGIGFAIPVNSVKLILTQLKTNGIVSRGYLGVSAGDLTKEILEQLSLPKDTRGVLVADVAKGQPAEKAGIVPYDIITAVNGNKVETALDLTQAITVIPVGELVKITLIHEKKEKTITAKLASRPSQLPESASSPRHSRRGSGKKSDVTAKLGVQVSDLGADVNRQFGLPPEAKGVVISGIDYDKPADRAGLERGDVILDIAGYKINSTKDLDGASSKLRGGSVIVRIRRYDQSGDSVVQVVILKLKD